MTASSPTSASTTPLHASSGGNGSNKQSRLLPQQQQQPSTTTTTATTTTTTTTSAVATNNAGSSSAQTSCPSFNSSAAFQQVKQTQASLARLTRVHQQQQQHQQQHNQGAGSTGGNGGQNNQSSQQQLAKMSPDASQQQQQQPKPTTFVDCLIRRFKNCFDEDFCTVPMFVVGSLSPGSDGTHLILPPCVSLGRQHINRFSSPKNVRLMNSIRESCRSIEELDLGGNKLTDLIEIYKILQCTPNLRFLNLSENDLSRTSPVAVASLTSASSTATVPVSAQALTGGSMIGLVAPAPAGSCSFGPSSAAGPFNQRNCLAPLTQNQPHSAMGTRRHSSLGQPSGAARSPTMSSSQAGTPVHLRARQTISRVAEARRMAAANALAQSKKTSSSMASKLAQSAAANGSLARQAAGACRAARTELSGTPGAASSSSPSATAALMGKQKPGSAGQRHQAGHHQASTMHLARSLSSLSAKDIRASSSTINRLAAHRASIRNEAGARSSLASANSRRSAQMGSAANRLGACASSLKQQQQQPLAPAPASSQQEQQKESPDADGVKLAASARHQKLYVEPIAENEDVDMAGEQQQISPGGAGNQTGAAGAASAASSGQHNQQTTTTTTPTTPSSRALQTTTGSNSNSNSNTLRSYCNNNTSLLSIQAQQSSSNFRRTFGSVRALALNNTGCQWKVVCSILSRMPNLEELHLSLNNYEKIDLDTNEFKHHSLKRLYLCNNPKLTNWEELDKLLIAFPSLEALSIADCNISQIPDNLDRAREWRKLCGLNINGWPIKEWPVVERLNQLPSLVDLKCRNLDVLNSIDEPRHHLIARLPKLQRLNGSEIEEREDAERAFLRFFMVNSHLERPARFHELMQIYGEVPQNIDVDVDLSPPSQARVRVIYLNRNHYCKADEDDVLMSEDFLLKLMDNIDASASVQPTGSSNNADGDNSQENMEIAETAATSAGPVRLFKDEGQEVMALEVDLRQSVRKFKSTIASLFGLDSQNLILYYIDHEMVGLMGPELIKHNQKKLWNYNVQDGDQFIVENR